jgi:hypothetical protein
MSQARTTTWDNTKLFCTVNRIKSIFITQLLIFQFSLSGSTYFNTRNSTTKSRDTLSLFFTILVCIEHIRREIEMSDTDYDREKRESVSRLLVVELRVLK